MNILVRRSVSPMERFVTDKSTRFCPTDTAEGTRIGCYSDQHSGITYAVLLICFTEIHFHNFSLQVNLVVGSLLSWDHSLFLTVHEVQLLSGRCKFPTQILRRTIP